MFEIDRAAFGEFIAKQRKEKGYTQKELAEKLFVSDKAVSKWERSLSMPDISLLIPLAEILEVSVTELLEGQKREKASEMNAEQVELLVKKALTFSEEIPENRREKKKRRAFLFCGAAALAILELWIGTFWLGKMEIDEFFGGLFVQELLSFIFGIYFWFFMEDKLPAYYDENKISHVGDGLFRMNMAGVYFNNHNWPYIVRALQIWSVVSMVILPLFYMLLPALFTDLRQNIGYQSIILILFLAGLFLPVYILGRKYENQGGTAAETKGTKANEMGRKKKKKNGIFLFLFMMILIAASCFSGTAAFRSGTFLGFVSHGGLRGWNAHYQSFDGTMRRTLYPASEAAEYMIEVETKEGELSIEIEDKSGCVIFYEEKLPTGTWSVTLTGQSRVKLLANHHKGSFSIRTKAKEGDG